MLLSGHVNSRPVACKGHRCLPQHALRGSQCSSLPSRASVRRQARSTKLLCASAADSSKGPQQLKVMHECDHPLYHIWMHCRCSSTEQLAVLALQPTQGVVPGTALNTLVLEAIQSKEQMIRSAFLPCPFTSHKYCAALLPPASHGWPLAHCGAQQAVASSHIPGSNSRTGQAAHL